MGCLEGRVAYVTGGAGGIGGAVIELFRAEGATVAAGDLDLADGTRAAAHLWLRHDVTRETDWQAAMSAVEANFGGLDILVNNAGVALAKDLEETTLEDWRRIMAVNLDGSFLGVRYGIAAMKAKRGAIVNLASIAGKVSAPQLAAYAASKAGVVGLTKSAARHCTGKGYQIRINAVLPSFADTDMVDGMVEVLGGGTKDPETLRERLNRRHPMARLARPQEVAQAVLYLASDQSSYTTGSELLVDGGYSA